MAKAREIEQRSARHDQRRRLPLALPRYHDRARELADCTIGMRFGYRPGAMPGALVARAEQSGGQMVDRPRTSSTWRATCAVRWRSVAAQHAVYLPGCSQLQRG